MLSNYSHWRPIGIATLSHGYGLSVTPLQLAHAYATIGAGGIKRPISFERISGRVRGEQVLDPKVARELVHLMEQVVAAGTATRAAVVGYRVAGKTGTAWKSVAGGYSTDRFMAVFAGLVPASHPKIATVVVIDEPSGTSAPGRYGGGAGLLQRHVGRAAPHGCAAGRSAECAGHDAGAGERTMSSAGVSLMWLLDGIAAVPANDARISDLTLDSRDVRSGSLFLALRGTPSARHRIRGRGGRARRDRRALGARARGGSARPRAGGVQRAGRRFAQGRWAASPTGSSTGPPRSCASSASRARTARPRAPTCWRSASCASNRMRPTWARSAGAVSARSRLRPTPPPMPSACTARSRGCARSACAMSRWKSPRMPSIRAGSTACTSIRPRSPT